MIDSIKKLLGILSTDEDKDKLKRKGQVYLFIIAIDEYMYERNLTTCKRDSEYLLSLFLNYSKTEIKRKNVYKLLDKEATKIRIFDQLRKFDEILNEDDNLILHWCGHSALSMKKSFFVPADGDPDNIHTWISGDLLTSYLKLYRVKNSILILNSHSGVSSIDNKLETEKLSEVPSKIDANLYMSLVNYLKLNEVGFNKSVWHFSKNIRQISNDNTIELKTDNTELNEYFNKTKREVENLIQEGDFVKAIEILNKISSNSDPSVTGRTTTMLNYLRKREEYNRSMHRPMSDSEIEDLSVDLVNRVHDCGYYLVPVQNSPLSVNYEKKETKIILFSAANTKDNDMIKLDEEYRAIDIELMRAKRRDDFELIVSTATRISDLQRKILRHKPYIVHFSGHGRTDGICMIQSDQGEVQIVENRPLGDLFGLFSDHIKCVFLNSCHSIHQSNIITKHIDFVICMSNAVKDKTSIKFASTFYEALGNGETIDFSFKYAKTSINLEGLSGQNIPKLLIKPSRNEN